MVVFCQWSLLNQHFIMIFQFQFCLFLQLQHNILQKLRPIHIGIETIIAVIIFFHAFNLLSSIKQHFYSHHKIYQHTKIDFITRKEKKGCGLSEPIFMHAVLHMGIRKEKEVLRQSKL
jgi:hypothetical protein